MITAMPRIALATADFDGLVHTCRQVRDREPGDGPVVLQAAVIAVAHPRWQERPLLVVVRKPGGILDRDTMLDFMRGRIATWWMPDDVAFVEAMPMTGTGKIH